MTLTVFENRLIWPIVATLTLGLAPFAPLPHFFEKMSWLFTGHSFAAIDVFDLFLHGAPWVWLLVTVILMVRERLKNEGPQREPSS